MREAESSARAEAVRFRHFTVLQGGQKQDAARQLGLPQRTLREWKRQQSVERRNYLRGRPLVRSGREDRSRVITTLEEFGPQLGLEPLQSIYPGMPRGELRDLLDRYRRMYSRIHRLTTGKLHWPVPGTVWAMDHAWLPKPIGNLRYAFSLRDLSSGFQFLWHPVAHYTAEDTVELLQWVFRHVGRPLVLKSDRGPAFISEMMQELLESHHVEHLLSPAYWPQYNGAVESGIRWLKRRTDHQATRAGHPGRWSAEDMERARRITNVLPQTGRRRGTPESLWNWRERLTPKLRQEFRASVQAELERVYEELGLSEEFEALTDRLDFKRIAISRALVAHGYLTHRRRRVSLPLKSRKAAIIS